MTATMSADSEEKHNPRRSSLHRSKKHSKHGHSKCFQHTLILFLARTARPPVLRWDFQPISRSCWPLFMGQHEYGDFRSRDHWQAVAKTSKGSVSRPLISALQSEGYMSEQDGSQRVSIQQDFEKSLKAQYCTWCRGRLLI